MPALKSTILDEKGASVIKIVGNRFKAVFGKIKENKEHDTEKPAS